MTYPNLKDLEELVSQGLVSKRKHLEHPLWVYNYTPKVAAIPPADWTEALSDARGLILDEDGEIIGRGFKKFWNYEQVKDQIPWDERCSINTKWDGSLIIVCWYKEELIFATRGSFESEQALWAKKHWKDRFYIGPNKGCSCLHEAIYPENKVVVDYRGAKTLVFLAEINNSNGLETSLKDYDIISEQEILEYKNINAPNEEGYVITFYPSCFRVKIKFEDYVRLHRIRFQTTKHSIWEILKNNDSLVKIHQLVEGIPETQAKIIKEYAYDLSAKFVDMKLKCRRDWEKIVQMQRNETSERSIAEWIKAKDTRQHALFGLWRGRGDWTKAIWRVLEPKKERLI